MIYFDKGTELETLARTLSELIIGSKLTTMIQELDLDSTPYGQSDTKWKRLHAAFCNTHNSEHSDVKIIKSIEWILSPSSFINSDSLQWVDALNKVNRILVFNGLKVNDLGKVVRTSKPSSFSDAVQRYNSLSLKLESFNIHPAIMMICRPEILSDNYFHLIFESSKLAVHKVQSISGLKTDGIDLLNKAFDGKSPIVVLNSLQTLEEKNEYFGLKAMLSLIVYIYRNPKAHKIKSFNPSSEEDAIVALLIISKALFLLENCSRSSAF